MSVVSDCGVTLLALVWRVEACVGVGASWCFGSPDLFPFCPSEAFPNLWIPVGRTFYHPVWTDKYNQSFHITCCWLHHLVLAKQKLSSRL